MDLFVTDGMFKIINGEENINAQFDNEPVETFECNEHAKLGPTHLWVKNVPAFLNKIKTARTLTLQVEIINNGLQEQKFNIAGLKWK